MKNSRFLPLLLFLISMTAAQVTLESYIEKDNLLIGDQTVLTIKAKVPDSLTVTFHELVPESDDITVVSEEIFPDSIRFTLAFWEPGEFDIPGIQVDILNRGKTENTLVTNPVHVVVKSVLKGEAGNLRDIKGMHEVRLGNPWIKVIYAGLFLLSLTLLYYFWKKRTKSVEKAEKWVKPKDPPHIAAKKELESLKPPYPVTRKSSEKYYLRLSEIFRKFIEEEFFIKALEMTTGELKEYLKKIPVKDETYSVTIDLLSRADLSKFAGNMPAPEQFSKDKTLAEQLIDTYLEADKNRINTNW